MKRFSPNRRLAAIAVLIGISAFALAGEGPAPQAVPGRRIEVPGGSTGSYGSYMSIDAKALAEMLTKKDFFLVNVHIPYAGEIALTDALIPFDRTDDLIRGLPKDKGAKIVLYCRSGRMSEIAAKDLVKRGYTNLIDLDGGMNAWQEAGFALAPAKR
jgi:rhodanese-related sulfurtransferase